jgi:hypothetical protein
MKEQTKKVGKWRFAALTAASAVSALFLAHTVLASVDKAFQPRMAQGSDTTTSVPSQTAVPMHNGSAPSPEGSHQLEKKPALPAGASDVSFSGDGKYMAYLLNGGLHVTNLSDSSQATMPEKDPVNRYIMMGSRDIVIYFTCSGGNLNVKTYNIGAGLLTVQKSFAVPSGSVVKAADYSNNTNMIVIDVSRGNAGAGDTVYSLNIMKTLRKASASGAANSLVLLNNSFDFYSVDGNHRLYADLKPVPAFTGQGVNLLGCDTNDTVYVQPLSDRSVVYELRNQSPAARIKLDNPGFLAAYATKSGIYLVYPDHIVDITKARQTVLTFDRQLRFLAVSGPAAYFADLNGNIVAKAI